MMILTTMSPKLRNSASRTVDSGHHLDSNGGSQQQLHTSTTVRRDRWWRTLIMALLPHCLSTLTVTYFSISILPYAGYMTIHLLSIGAAADGDNNNHSSYNNAYYQAGWYSGLLTSTFWMGRCLTQNIWKQLSQSHGIVTCQSLSLIWGSLFSFAFGVVTSTDSFSLACLCRFCLGMTCCSSLYSQQQEQVHEHQQQQYWYNHNNNNPSTAVNKEQDRLQNLIIKSSMNMWAWSLCVSPVLAGLISEPVRQYPSLFRDDDLRQLLESFPFLLPNLLGTGLALITLIAVNLCIVEPPAPPPMPHTLPTFQSLHTIISSDLMGSVQRVLSAISEEEEEEDEDDRNATEENPFYTNPTNGKPYASYDSILQAPPTNGATASCNASTATTTEQVVMEELQHNLTTDESLIFFFITDSQTLIEAMKAEITTRIAQCEQEPQPQDTEQQQEVFRRANPSANNRGPPPPPQLHAGLQEGRRRKRLIVSYVWLFMPSLIVAAVEEALPLLCIVLGSPSFEIGTILSGGGMVLALCQYGLYTALVTCLGLRGTMRLSWVLLLVSLSAMASVMFIWNPTESSLDNYSQQHLTRNLCLVIFLALVRIFGLTYFTSGVLLSAVMDSNTNLCRHQQQPKAPALKVEELDSGSLLTLGMCAVRVVGPMLGGWLVALSFSLLNRAGAH